MSGLSYSQVSGNDWSSTAPSPEMLYEIVQPVSPKFSPSPESRIKEQYAQRIQEQLERQMACFEQEHEAGVAELRRSYVFTNDREIRTFFKAHRTAPQLLLEAVPHLYQTFGVDTVFKLWASTDEYGAQTLYIIAIWPGHLRDVRHALERFDEEWWIPNSRQASGDLAFTYELV